MTEDLMSAAHEFLMSYLGIFPPGRKSRCSRICVFRYSWYVLPHEVFTFIIFITHFLVIQIALLFVRVLIIKIVNFKLIKIHSILSGYVFIYNYTIYVSIGHAHNIPTQGRSKAVYGFRITDFDLEGVN